MVFDWLWWGFHLLGNKYGSMIGFLFIRFWENEGKKIDFNLEILDFILINWEGNKIIWFCCDKVLVPPWYGSLAYFLFGLFILYDFLDMDLFLMDLLKKCFMQRVWLHKRTGGVCLSTASKGLAIIGIGDWRYWNHIPTEESRWDLFNFLTLFF